MLKQSNPDSTVNEIEPKAQKSINSLTSILDQSGYTDELEWVEAHLDIMKFVVTYFCKIRDKIGLSEDDESHFDRIVNKNGILIKSLTPTDTILSILRKVINEPAVTESAPRRVSHYDVRYELGKFIRLNAKDILADLTTKFGEYHQYVVRFDDYLNAYTDRRRTIADAAKSMGITDKEHRLWLKAVRNRLRVIAQSEYISILGEQ